MAASIRVNQLKSNWATSKLMAGEGRVADLEAALGPERSRMLAECGRLSWVPIEVDVALSRAVESVVGEGMAYHRTRRSVAATMDTTLMRPLLDGARRVFGLDPRKALKLVKQGWTVVFKDCGHADYECLEDTSAVVRLFDLPEVMLGTPSYVRAIAGSMHGLLDVCGVEGTTEVLEASLDTRRLELMLEWTRARD